jgi:hypothetical protein
MYKYITIQAIPAPMSVVLDPASDYSGGVKKERALAMAAPELLAALERFTMAIEQGRYPELQGVACDAFAAINKAKDV